MGVTIHYRGRAKDELSLARITEHAADYAQRLGWRWNSINEPMAKLPRSHGEDEWEYVGRTVGVVLFPSDKCEPVRLEFDSDLYVEDSVKTQFASPDVHIQVVQLLQGLEPLFAELDVFDEGEYWDSGDRAQLQQKMDECFQALEQYLANNHRAEGPVRLPSGRIVDVMQPPLRGNVRGV